MLQQKKSILGMDLITPSEINYVLKSDFFPQNLAEKYCKNLPPSSTFKWAKKNDFAIVPAPPTIMSLKDIIDTDYFPLFIKKGDGWYEMDDFYTKDKIHPKWLCLRKKPSFVGEDWSFQDRMILSTRNMYIPNVAKVFWFLSVYALVRGVLLFGDGSARTHTLNRFKEHVAIGNSQKGICFPVYEDGDEKPNLGLAQGLILSEFI